MSAVQFDQLIVMPILDVASPLNHCVHLKHKF